tara:strand:- start:33 stop:422 length:390 start_codon:yes stop_codon:yes gene_type:complete
MNNLIKVFIFFLYLSIIFINLSTNINSQDLNQEQFVQIKILDKISSKTSNLEIKIGEKKKFKNLLIKILKCKNSEFDDNPETTAYLQVKDTSDQSNDEVFIFNDWTFSSSPSLRPFDHPVYDIWLIKCY